MIPCTTKLWRPSAACEAMYLDRKAKIDVLMQKAENRDATPYECFLKTFGDLPLKHPQKHEFLILCWQQQWGESIQIESRGVLNHWLVRMARGLCFGKRLVLMGCGSSGKTGITAAYCYTVWKSRPFNSSVFLSTTSSEAGESRTWGAVKDWHKLDRFKVGKRIESLHLITLDEEIRDEDGDKERSYRNAIKCINIKTGQEGKNVMSAIVGRKNDIVVWCCDEFNYMDMGVLAARVNLNTNPHNQFFGLCNAPDEGDPAYIDATPYGDKFPDGWRSVDKDTQQSWPTERGLCLYFNGADSPNFKAMDSTVPFPKLMNETIRQDMEKDAGGEDSPMYWKQFYGFPPTVDISDKVLTHKLLENNGAFEEPLWMDVQQVMLAGLDLGFRETGDPCVIHFGKVGKTPQGRRVLACESDGIALTPKQNSKDAFEVQIAKQVVEQCRKRGCAHLALDVTGDGGILLQQIERYARENSFGFTVIPISFGGTASDHVTIPGERRTAKEMFINKVSELWMSARVCVLNKVVFGLGKRSNCVNQLCARKMVSDEKKRQGVESKKIMKKRLKRSPDHADAFSLLIHLALRHGLSGLEVVKPKEAFTPDKFIQKQPGPQRYQAGHRSIYSGR